MKRTGYYCHVNNGGMSVKVKSHADSGLIFYEIVASYEHFGIPGPTAIIPVRNSEERDNLIKMLSEMTFIGADETWSGDLSPPLATS